MKFLFGFLLLLSILLFSFVQWGGALTGTGKNGPALGELNPEKIQLLDMPAAKQLNGSAIPAAHPTVVVSLPLAVSAPVPLQAAASAPATVPAPVVLPVPVAKTAVKTCMEWGEFSGTDLARAEKVLAGFKFGDDLTQRTVEYNIGYLVYIPPLANKTAINKKIQDLKSAGIEEYFVLNETRQLQNAISLGVFKTEEAARHFLDTIKKKGFRTVKMSERKRKLKFIVFVIKNVDAEVEARLLKLQKEFVNSELKQIACGK